MCSTLNNMAKYIKEIEKVDLLSVSNAMETGALKGAKGNSGVILSQIIKGMSLIFADCKDKITTKDFAKALDKGAEIAYSVVRNPKEGTILTVIRVVGEYAIKVAKKTDDFSEFLNKVLIKGNEAVEKTIEQLPELKKANVVDSGGKGLMYFIEGMYQIILGNVIEKKEVESSNSDAFEIDNDYENITFTYCTEIWIEPLKSSTTQADIKKLEEKLDKIGDSLIVVGDLQKIKLHVHTNTPNKAIEYALQLGDINFPKIENMRLQYEKILKEREKQHKAVGTCAVATGSGFKKLFSKELKVDKVVDGEKTMNPSVEDLVKAIKNVNADTVYVFPNNKNVILACERAKAELEGQINVVVVKTKHMLQGISALVVLDLDASIEDNLQAMNDAIQVKNFFGITKAAKNSNVDDMQIKAGEYFAVSDKIISHDKDEINCILNTISQLIDELGFVFTLTLYYGKDVSNKFITKVQKNISEKFDDLEINIIDGGQELYDFFVKLD